MTQLHLLPARDLVKTGPFDHADWNFRLILGAIQRARFRLMMRQLKNDRFGRLLEIGYGSGVFMPELSRRCKELHGVDVHRHEGEVAESLRHSLVQASLVTASAEDMPYEDAFFDAIVAVSSIEFVPDLDAACREIRRVLRPGGRFYVITPGHSPLLDFGLRVLTGESADNDYGRRREAVLPTLRRYFSIEEQDTLPAVASSIVCLYTALTLRAPRAS